MQGDLQALALVLQAFVVLVIVLKHKNKPKENHLCGVTNLKMASCL